MAMAKHVVLVDVEVKLPGQRFILGCLETPLALATGSLVAVCWESGEVDVYYVLGTRPEDAGCVPREDSPRGHRVARVTALVATVMAEGTN